MARCSMFISHFEICEAYSDYFKGGQVNKYCYLSEHEADEYGIFSDNVSRRMCQDGPLVSGKSKNENFLVFRIRSY
jgi:hypothetical protein